MPYLLLIQFLVSKTLSDANVGVPPFSATIMAMALRLDLDRYDYQPAVAHATLGDHVLGHVLHFASVPLQHGHFHAVAVVEVDMHRGKRQIVVIMERVGETLGKLTGRMIVDIYERGDAFAVTRCVNYQFLRAGAHKVADRL